ncbi:MAG TPA: HdeD family acid-resistance protein [Planctomicrobium sp.]|nr:HdeD family acid-resistance protein [Planctomicrobium sp.]
MSSVPRFVPEMSALKKDWIWFLALGLALSLFGAFAIALPFVATVEFVTILGILILVSGAFLVVSAFQAARWKGFLLQLLIGVLYLVSGFLILENPIEGAAGLTLILAAVFLTSGLFRIVVSLVERFPGWGWVLLNGGVSFVLGLVIWRQFPECTLWIIGLLVGFELLFNGWAWIMLALFVKNLPDADQHESESIRF